MHQVAIKVSFFVGFLLVFRVIFSSFRDPHWPFVAKELNLLLFWCLLWIERPSIATVDPLFGGSALDIFILVIFRLTLYILTRTK